MGIEVTEPIDTSTLGPITKSLCDMLLLVVDKFSSTSIHYSYGAKTKHKNSDKMEIERPHIVAPIQYNIDNLIITKNEVDGSNIKKKNEPTLGYVLDNVSSSINNNYTGNQVMWNTNDTYTFTFNSNVLDLLQWKIVNLPINTFLGDISLTRFWSPTSKLRIVAYEHNNNENCKEGRCTDGNASLQQQHQQYLPHVTQDLRYMFCAQVESMLTSTEQENMKPVQNITKDNKYECDEVAPNQVVVSM